MLLTKVNNNSKRRKKMNNNEIHENFIAVLKKASKMMLNNFKERVQFECNLEMNGRVYNDTIVIRKGIVSKNILVFLNSTCLCEYDGKDDVLRSSSYLFNPEMCDDIANRKKINLLLNWENLKHELQDPIQAKLDNFKL